MPTDRAKLESGCCELVRKQPMDEPKQRTCLHHLQRGYGLYHAGSVLVAQKSSVLLKDVSEHCVGDISRPIASQQK